MQSDCAGGAAGAVVGEVVAMSMVKDWTKTTLERLTDPNRVWTAQEIVREDARLKQDLADFKQKGVDIAALTGGLASALVSGKVDSGASAGRNAAENNGLVAAPAVLPAAYMVYAGDGNPVQGLIRIGEGEDPISQGTEQAAESAVNWLATNAPWVTNFVLSTRKVVAGGVEATITYVDGLTGGTVIRAWDAASETIADRWNKIDPTIRSELKGGAAVVLFGAATAYRVAKAPVKALDKLEDLREAAAGAVAKAKSLPVTDDLPRNIHSGQQGKHIEGHNNFDPSRSVLTENPQELLDGIHSGRYPVVREIVRGNSISRFVDFGKPIGSFKRQDGSTVGPTRYGQVVHGKNGAHIVPANPEQY